MQDKFWTPELWCEFINQGPLIGALETEMEQFKSSKSPKKEWEVVAFKYLPNGDIITNTQKFEWDFAMNGDGLYTTHSVRRLSDQEVFSVGDRFATFDRKDVIERFEYEDGRIKVIAKYNIFYADSECGMTMRKLPQKIFTTIDGVDIYEDGNFWHVNEDWTLSNFGVSTEWIDYSKPDKDFSTREAAEQYILDHAPRLSLNEVREKFKLNGCSLTGMQEKLLTALVKQKLNQ